MTAEATSDRSSAFSYDVSVLVISFNTRELTLACLKSIYEETRRVRFEVVVFDNASVDGSVEAIRHGFPLATVISSGQNIGFAAGNNRAAAAASGEYLLLLNSDTVVLEGAIDTLVEFARQNPEAAIYGGRTLHEDKSLNPHSCHRRESFWGLCCQVLGLNSLFRTSPIFNRVEYGGWKRDCDRHVEIVSGCFLLIERRLWAALEGFYEGFFMYCEEDDLCIRASALGARPLVCARAAIIHYGGRSETSNADKLVKLLKSRNLLGTRHYSRLYARVARQLHRLYVLRRWAMWRLVELFGASPRHQSSTFKEVWQRRQEWSFNPTDVAPFPGQAPSENSRS